MLKLNVDTNLNNKCSQVAIIKGGLNDGDIIYLCDEEYNNEKNIKSDISEYINISDLKKILGSNKRALSNTFKNIQLNNIPQNVKNIYDVALKKQTKDLNKDYKTLDGRLFHLPNLKSPERLYVCGPSGSGKSTYCYYYINFWK